VSSDVRDGPLPAGWAATAVPTARPSLDGGVEQAANAHRRSRIRTVRILTNSFPESGPPAPQPV
jgi:hypothetical protein